MTVHARLLRKDLLARIEARLNVVPAAIELQVERAHLLADLNRPKEAAQAYARAVQAKTKKYPVTRRAYCVLPFNGTSQPITVLLLVTPDWGNAPFRKYLTDQTFLTLQIVVDFQDAELSLPPHQLVINCISDADLRRDSLMAATALLSKTDAPVINLPSHVLATTRDNVQRLSSIAGVRTPRTTTFSRQILESVAVGSILAGAGFAFPLLARAAGYHTGLHFIRAENLEELVQALPGLPGDNISIIEYLDARSADGLIRKYRVMMIEGKLYPAHLAVSRDWKVHFFSSTAPESLEHREADREFLENMPRVLGARAMEALGRIQEALGLDYAGIDFSLNAAGDILVFEANATMNINPPDPGELWLYRQAPVQRIADAVQTLFLNKALPGLDCPSDLTLQQIEARLKLEPGRVDLLIEKVRLLIVMERYNDAKDVLMGILTKEPTHVVALYNLGVLLNLLGYYPDAQKMYRAVVALSPGQLPARMNLARLLREAGELKEARVHYETVLQLAPDHAEAHRDLAYVLRYLGEDEAAREHGKIAVKNSPAREASVNGRKESTRVLILTSPCGGNSPLTRYLDKKAIPFLEIIPDLYDPAEPLPSHGLIVNAIGDADYSELSLEPAVRLLEQTTKPVINRPERIRFTGRAENSRLLGTLDGVTTPRIITLSKEILAGSEGPSILEQQGFTFPLLLRSPGFHEGKNFVRLETASELSAAVVLLPGQSAMAIQFLDAREEDGKIRKHRVMMVDGKLYPLHKAVSRKWMIHYFSAEMVDSVEHRAEDQAFLEDMPGVLGPKAVQALEKIRDTLGLDYCGADFSIGRQGEILLFEANASMAAPLPPSGEQWDYRRRHAERIQEAVREMIRRRAVDSPPI